VMVPDLRGWGESAPRHNMNPGSSGYSIEYQTAMRALLVGKTMAGMHVLDALRAFDVLASRTEVDPRRIAIFGKGDGGAIGLYAAALEPRVAKVLAEGALASYLSVAQQKFHERLERILIPGVLGDFDLPDVVALIATRPVWIASPVRPNQTAALLGDVVRQYEVARLAFERAKRPAHFRILQRLQGVTLEKNYNSWLREDMQ
jgi:pimeloyl-ACP methyl ester carboxylesterase